MTTLWKAVNMKSLTTAMAKFDLNGADFYRKDMGFNPTRGLAMYLNDRGPYEARLLLALATKEQFEKAVVPSDFTNQDGHMFLVKEHGFTMRDKLRRAA